MNLTRDEVNKIMLALVYPKGADVSLDKEIAKKLISGMNQQNNNLYASARLQNPETLNRQNKPRLGG